MKIKINQHTYRIPTHWEELTLAQCVWLWGRVKKSSAALREHYLSYASADGPKEATDKGELTGFVSEAVGYLIAAPAEEAKLLEEADLMVIASAILPRFVCGVLGCVDYASTGASGFRHRCRGYQYPKAGADVMGMPTPLSHLSAGELCQVSDIVMSGNMALAPLAVAICCRQKGEAYDEQKALKRAAGFAALPASVYWEVWSRVSAAHGYLRGCYAECYGKEGTGSGKPVLWSNQLTAMAVGNPSSLLQLQRMNGYEFVHLMNESTKQKAEEWKMNAALSGLRAM